MQRAQRSSCWPSRSARTGPGRTSSAPPGRRSSRRFAPLIGDLAAGRTAGLDSRRAPDDAQIDTVAMAVIGALMVSALVNALHAADRPAENLVASPLLALSGLQA